MLNALARIKVMMGPLTIEAIEFSWRRLSHRMFKQRLKVGYARLCTISKTRQNIRADYMYILELESTRPRPKAQNSES